MSKKGSCEQNHSQIYYNYFNNAKLIYDFLIKKVINNPNLSPKNTEIKNIFFNNLSKDVYYN